MRSTDSTNASARPSTQVPEPGPEGAFGDSGRSQYSRFVQRIRRRYASQMALLTAGAPVRSSMEHTLQALFAEGLRAGAALRVLRQLVMERLVVLDCDGDGAGQVPLAVVTRAMTELAELALDVAVRESQKTLDALQGAPQRPDTDSPCR